MGDERSRKGAIREGVGFRLGANNKKDVVPLDRRGWCELPKSSCVNRCESFWFFLFFFFPAETCIVT